MFDIGFSELAVIGVVALIVIGPERLPKVARTVGHLLGRAQRYAATVKSDISRELELEELKKTGQQFQQSLHDTETRLPKKSAALSVSCSQ
jgi:Sec-independent protein translocase TatB